MDQLDAIRVLLAVADKGSFVGAARVLRLSPAAVTRAVAQLECELGLALLLRTTRSVRVSEAGAIYVERCRRILADLDDAKGAVRGRSAVPRGVLTITAPVLFGRLHILPIAEALMAEHAFLSLRLVFLDRVTHLVEEGFDLAIRIGSLSDSALIGVPLAEVRRVTVASPQYLKRRGEPKSPEELKNHQIISFEGIGSTDSWQFGGETRTGVSVTPRLAVNNAEAAIASALRGHGITRVLSYQVSDAIGAGDLKRVLRNFEPAAIPVTLLYQASRRGAANVAAFVEAARRYFSQRRWN